MALSLNWNANGAFIWGTYLGVHLKIPRTIYSIAYTQA